MLEANVSQPYGPPLSFSGIALPLIFAISLPRFYFQYLITGLIRKLLRPLKLRPLDYDVM
jgi:hypothetical protein